jgi:hypothetical protein
MYVLLLALTIPTHPRTSTDIRNYPQPSAIMSFFTGNIPHPDQAIPDLMEKLKCETEAYNALAQGLQKAIRDFIKTKHDNNSSDQIEIAMRKMSIDSLESLFDLQFKIRKYSRAALHNAIEECNKNEGSILPVYSNAFPDGMWEVAQTELDDYYKRKGIPIPRERREMEYHRLGLFRHDTSGPENEAQKEAKAFLLECFKKHNAQNAAE